MIKIKRNGDVLKETLRCSFGTNKEHPGVVLKVDDIEIELNLTALCWLSGSIAKTVRSLSPGYVAACAAFVDDDICNPDVYRGGNEHLMPRNETETMQARREMAVHNYQALVPGTSFDDALAAITMAVVVESARRTARKTEGARDDHEDVD